MMLGDNRDNSEDSRYIGLVPRALLIGRAERVLASADITGNWAPRTERFGMSLYPQLSPPKIGDRVLGDRRRRCYDGWQFHNIAGASHDRIPGTVQSLRRL
jgi:hypothetical protein